MSARARSKSAAVAATARHGMARRAGPRPAALAALAAALLLGAACGAPSVRARGARTRGARLVAPAAPAPARGGPANFSFVPVRELVFDLDLPPAERWAKHCAEFASSTPLLETFARATLARLGDAEAAAVLKLAADVTGFLGAEAAAEIEGCGKAMGLELGVLTTLNLSYILRRLMGGDHNTTGPLPAGADRAAGSIACTSLAADGGARGECAVVHGRNLDWGLPDELKNLTVALKWHKGGEELMTTIGPIGFFGVLTAFKSGRYAASINERAHGGPFLEDLAELLLLGRKLPSHALREALLAADTYADLGARLAAAELVAPVYYVVSGAQRGEASVITRDRTGMAGAPVSLDNGGSFGRSWFVLQTNYDYWEDAPVSDDRRGYALRHLDELGAKTNRSASMEQMRDRILKAWPTLNDGTSLVSVMCAETGEYLAYNVRMPSLARHVLSLSRTRAP